MSFSRYSCRSQRDICSARMLRSALLRLHPRALGPRPISFRFTSSQATVSQEADDQGAEEVWGTSCGAGPSRRPLGEQRPPAHSVSEQNARSSSARRLRSVLPSIIDQSCTYTSLRRRMSAAGLPSIDRLSRLQLHILLHALLRLAPDRPVTTHVLRRAVMQGASRHHRGLIHQTTLASFFSLDPIPPDQSSLKEPIRATSPNATFTDFASRRPSRRLRLLLHTLQRLQHSRHPRPLEVYYSVVEHCLAENKFDIAAKVYVGLVEEWVTEGRVAIGADPSDFYAGGGPPRDREKREMKSELLKMWWRDVRSWALPGEVISPHDRLDLWHPVNLSLGEKLIRFPIPVPCSPPKLVPPPGPYLLARILETFKLDPDKATPAEFAASMRACAMLASLVLSRTIPHISCNVLLDTLSQTQLWPPVYPESFTEPPRQEDAWAYQASTHIHLALASLLWRIPFCPLPIPRRIGGVSGAHLYMTRSISMRGCLVLIRYTLDRVRYPEALKRLMPHVNRSFGRVASSMRSVYNVFTSGTSKLGLKWFADKSMGDLFAGTALSEEQLLARTLRYGDGTWAAPKYKAPVLDNRRTIGKDYDDFRYRRPTTVIDEDQERSALATFEKAESILPKAQVDMVPNEESVIALLDSLAATGQFYRLRQSIYRLVPFLSFAKWMEKDLVNTLLTQHRVEPGYSGRPHAGNLSPRLYSALLRAIQKADNDTTANWAYLAHRVFRLALKAEFEFAKEYRKTIGDPTAIVSPQYRLCRDDFETMLRIWGLRTVYRVNGLAEANEAYWRMKAPAQPEDMIWAVYLEARSRVEVGDFEFGWDIFDLVLRGMAQRWGLNEPGLLFGRDYMRQRECLKMVLTDMEAFGFSPRVNWVRKVMHVKDDEIEGFGFLREKEIWWPIPGEEEQEQVLPEPVGMISDERLRLLMRLEMGHGWKTNEDQNNRETVNVVSSA
ncbi:hypothetical protein BCR39DRAFT_515652 [Naematelia encephala]|uniref:Uncharacterized protein n=1 Tax=Naematelia encephala TaxID=71784 RepID=A0A1Y2BJY7_9TREE|nr:hypothetical protein BCR39DRAFT_515652 [Naematelia encephala]